MKRRPDDETLWTCRFKRLNGKSLMIWEHSPTTLASQEILASASSERYHRGRDVKRLSSPPTTTADSGSLLFYSERYDRTCFLPFYNGCCCSVSFVHVDELNEWMEISLVLHGMRRDDKDKDDVVVARLLWWLSCDGANGDSKFVIQRVHICRLRHVK